MDKITMEEERLSSRHGEVREVAARLFYENSYHGTNLKQIAKALGIRAPSLYNHIASKQQLLNDIMFDNTLSLRQEVSDAIASVSDADTVEQIRQATQAHIRHSIRRRYQVHVSIYELPSLDEPAKEKILELRAENAVRWRKLIERCVEEGACRTTHPELAARIIVDLGAGIARWYRGDLQDEDTLAKYYGELALRIIDATDTAMGAI